MQLSFPGPDWNLFGAVTSWVHFFHFLSLIKPRPVAFGVSAPSSTANPFLEHLVYHISFFETESLYKVLEFIMKTRLASNSLRSTCICLQSSGIKDVCHLVPLHVYSLNSTRNVFRAILPKNMRGHKIDSRGVEAVLELLICVSVCERVTCVQVFLEAGRGSRTSCTWS